MKKHLEKIKELYENQILSNKDYRKQLDDLKQNRDYSEEYKATQKQKMGEIYRETANNVYAEVLKELSEMKAQEKTHLDVNDTSLINALTLIKNMGKDMPYSIAQDINTAFKGNQPALAILQRAFKENDVYNDEIDNLCYNVNERYDSVAQALKKELMSDWVTGTNITFVNEWIKDIDSEPVTEVKEINDTPAYNFI